MPGILVETGFLSNASDEKFLRSDDGQSYIASAIYRAFKEYKLKVEDPGSHAEMAIFNKPAATKDIRFRVQFASSSKEKSADKFRDVKDVRVYEHNGMFKYTSGNFSSFEEAMQYQKALKGQKKYRDAFIVAFQKEERIDVNEARKISGQ